MIKTIIGVLVVVAAAVCGGMLIQSNQANAELEAALKQAQADLASAQAQPLAKPEVIERIVTVAKPGSEDGAAAAEIARLKAALAELKAQPTTAPVPLAENQPGTALAPPEERTPENMKSFMDRMKEEDPERYARMQEQQKSFRDRAAQGFGERLGFFNELDVSGLSADKMEVLAGTVEKLSEMSELLAVIEENPDDVAAFEMRGKAREMMRDVSDAMRSTRQVLVDDMIAGLGYNATETQELTDYLGQINEMTSMRSIFRPPARTDGEGGEENRGGGGRGPGGGGPRF